MPGLDLITWKNIAELFVYNNEIQCPFGTTKFLTPKQLNKNAKNNRNFSLDSLYA